MNAMSRSRVDVDADADADKMVPGGNSMVHDSLATL